MDANAVPKHAAAPVLDPEVAALLATLDAGFPDVTTMAPPELRQAIRGRRGPLAKLPDMQQARDVRIDGPGGPLDLRIYRPHRDHAALPVVVFAHGGGFVFCDLDSHDEFCRSMAEGVGAVVVSVDYRLAPEHQAPAAHDDMYAALEWASAHAADFGGDPTRIAVAGDSAGGNLAATVAIAARERGGPALAGQVLLYPVIDDDFDTESYRRFGIGYYNTAAAMRWYWQKYAPNGTDDPRLVPTRARSLAGLPPAVVITAELDPPCSSGDSYADLLASAGVPVRHRRYDGLFHGFLTFADLTPTTAARQEIWHMLRELLAPTTGPGEGVHR
ncbi:alpha/beta hydrolase [Nocardia sp. NPDC059180]|uniref:alpha/beta hydrolase n=1 Tax=Nocardia sp. NPDC059180 TaxID=3346761 RepID=UPI00369E4337